MLKSIVDSIRKYYHGKKLLRVYRIRAAAHVSGPDELRKFTEDSWRRLFLTFFFALLFSGGATALSRATHLSNWLAIPISLLALVASVEVADRIWLERYRVTNTSDFLILRGLSFLELRALEDSICLNLELSGKKRAMHLSGRATILGFSVPYAALLIKITPLMVAWEPFGFTRLILLGAIFGFAYVLSRRTWAHVGRHVREVFRIAVHYWPVTLFLVREIGLGITGPS